MIHINKFVDKIKAAESRNVSNSMNFPMTVREAKDLHADITKLLLALQELQSQKSETSITDTEIIMSGGDW